jgi:hypothetical protein
MKGIASCDSSCLVVVGAGVKPADLIMAVTHRYDFTAYLR